MKLISWNVNGIRAAWAHGLSALMDNAGADIYAFQETKTDEPFRDVELEGYHAYWSAGKRKGYSGTMCLTRVKPMKVSYGLDDENFDTEGRVITMEFEEFFFVNCYVPRPTASIKRADYRESWDLRFTQYLYNLRYQKPVIVCGDFNVTVSDRDVYPENKQAERENEAFLSIEREYLRDIIENGFVDTYRFLHPEEEKYTWWSTRRFMRKDNKGWRLDYFLVVKTLQDRIVESTMLTEVFGSDHCPILLEMDMDFIENESPRTVPKGYEYTYADLVRMELDKDVVKRIKRSNLASLWESIDWEQVESNLARMQCILAKCAYRRNHDEIRTWQRRIVVSIDAKLMAVRHTCNMAGSGVDCIQWKTPHEKMLAALSLTSYEYRAMPSRLLLLTSKNGKQRRIHVETYHDRAMQCLYAYTLDPVAESWGDRTSFAYRKGRSLFDVNEFIKKALSGRNAPEWVFMADVRKCYENISHEWILENIPSSSFMLHQFLRAGYVFGGDLFPTDMGVGIGCSLSPIIANMTLDGLQRYVYDRLYPEGTHPDYADGYMVRYADDILFFARTEQTARRIEAITEEFLDERGLMLASEKSRVLHISEGFTFMSRTYYKQGDEVLSRPSDTSVMRFMDGMRDMIEGYHGSQKSLIDRLNRKIDGWTSYHKTSEAEDVFRKMDVYISALLLKLCESKHHDWSREKIVRTYFINDGRGRYAYCLTNKKEVRVKSLADTLLVDYNAMNIHLNPYIRTDYFERRSKERAIYNVTGVYRAIWNRQEGLCHYCGAPMNREDEKALIEAFPRKTRFISRMAYIHKKCLQGTFEEVYVPSLPESVNEVMILLEELESRKKTLEERCRPLSEFFRTSSSKSITLTFKEMEEIMGESLGAASQTEEFWYRTDGKSISACWLDNGYSIKRIHLDVRPRVTFGLASQSRNTAKVNIPESIRNGFVPLDAKYELESIMKDVVRRYGL